MGHPGRAARPALEEHQQIGNRAGATGMVDASAPEPSSPCDVPRRRRAEGDQSGRKEVVPQAQASGANGGTRGQPRNSISRSPTVTTAGRGSKDSTVAHRQPWPPPTEASGVAQGTFPPEESLMQFGVRLKAKLFGASSGRGLEAGKGQPTHDSATAGSPREVIEF